MFVGTDDLRSAINMHPLLAEKALHMTIGLVYFLFLGGLHGKCSTCIRGARKVSAYDYQPNPTNLIRPTQALTQLANMQVWTSL